MFEINKDRFERLRALEPIQAIETWLANDFGLGDELAMLEAIVRHPGILLASDQITDVIALAIEVGIDARTTLVLLVDSEYLDAHEEEGDGGDAGFRG